MQPHKNIGGDGEEVNMKHDWCKKTNYKVLFIVSMCLQIDLEISNVECAILCKWNGGNVKFLYRRWGPYFTFRFVGCFLLINTIVRLANHNDWSRWFPIISPLRVQRCEMFLQVVTHWTSLGMLSLRSMALIYVGHCKKHFTCFVAL